MAASLDGVFVPSLQEKIKESHIFVVGAGGIGCEILKNLVMSGFRNIDIIDLDTIDVSNLNRQFLFHREHVGKSKALVAKESALNFNPDVNITAYHDSIFSTKYGVNFYRKFSIVLNALDNRAARNHVNRMCLNADVTLIESGTAGYNGQVELISKGLTQCYECTPKPAQKTFPGCTIRNTPSEPIHCIVWAKHLFNQLFGETVDDEDISPDQADPEANGEGEDNVSANGNITRINTRQWAKKLNYEPESLFNKFFHDDINYLLSMSNLWKTRKAPTPIKFDIKVEEDFNNNIAKTYHSVWGIDECKQVFANCLNELKSKMEALPEEDTLVWDKDEQASMDFVAACANIRANIFNIERKSRFDIKSMAGNIIPAIATTNAITAGVVVMHTFKVLQGQKEKCTNVYMRPRPNPRQELIVPEKFLVPPNPNCYVCSADPAIRIKIDTNAMTIKDFRDDVLIKTLNMVNPDVGIDAKGIVVISSEEGETECNENKLLKEMDIVDGVILKCDDFFQDYELSIIVEHFDSKHGEPLFEAVLGANEAKPKEAKKDETDAEAPKSKEKDDKTENKTDDKPAKEDKKVDGEKMDTEDSDDDICIVEDDEEKPTSTAELKRTASEVQSPSLAKKRKPSIQIIDEDDITEILDSDEDDGPTKIKRCRIAEENEEGDGAISSN